MFINPFKSDACGYLSSLLHAAQKNTRTLTFDLYDTLNQR